jgi:ABC-type multidrug transport system fused ATPase/permease subunit
MPSPLATAAADTSSPRLRRIAPPAKVWEGLKLLLGPGARLRLFMIFMGSLAVSFLEVIGLLTIIPLVQLISSTDDSTGLLGWIESFFDYPSRSRLSIILATMVMGAFIAKAAFVVLFRWWASGYVFGQEARTGAELLERYMHAPYWLHLERNSAEFLRTLGDSTSQAYSGFVMASINFGTEAVVALVIVSVLVAVQPLAALAVALYFVVAGYLYLKLIAKRSTEAGRVLSEQSMRSIKTANQALGSVKEVKIRNSQSYFVDQYSQARREMAGAKRLAGFLTELPKYVLEVIFITGVGLLSLTVVARSTSKDVLGLLALFVAAGFRLLPSLVKMMSSYTATRTGRVGFNLVVADILAFPDIPAHGKLEFNPRALPLDDTLEVERISFSYSENLPPVLSDVSFSVSAGESIGIVGASGAGKSTLVDILLGLHLPDSGRITTDGVDITTNMPGWQSKIGLVPQDVYILDDSLMANIAFGIPDEEVDPDALERVIRQAQLTQFVDDLPDGINSTVGERGLRISGGQRQRIGVARSLYSQPSLLILDEATSALDNETEMRISETIQALHGSLTLIVVAHRLSTIRDCDRILFLDKGFVRAIGTFDELVRSDPDFANLARLGSVGSDPIAVVD